MKCGLTGEIVWFAAPHYNVCMLDKIVRQNTVYRKLRGKIKRCGKFFCALDNFEGPV